MNSATERSTRSLSLVTCIYPMCNLLFSSFLVSSTPHRRAYILKIAPALVAVRWVTRVVTPCGPSWVRFLEWGMVTSLGLWSVVWVVRTRSAFGWRSGFWVGGGGWW